MDVIRLPTVREIELYYFDMYELINMLGRPDNSYIENLLRTGKVWGVKHKGCWMVPPSQIPVLRSLIPFAPMKTDCLTESRRREVRSPVKLRHNRR